MYYTSDRIQYTLRGHGFDNPSPNNSKYFKEYSTDLAMLTIAQQTIVRGTIISPGQEPGTIMVEADLDMLIGEGTFAGRYSEYTSWNVVILRQVPEVPDVYYVRTQYPVAPH